MIPPPLRSATRPLDPNLVKLLEALKPGQRIHLTQTVRVGFKKWTTTVPGVFRHMKYLATGLTTERGDDDDVVVVTVHFTKDNGELSSVALDEQSKIEVIA
ncbi:MAG: hypothetical protein K2R98_11755 [Gemmataceae bacterium]|nr:hypothetical protein [Gemmataceae bacterium]